MTISSNMLSMLSAQMQHELENKLFYQNLASYAAFNGLDGTCAWMSKQAAGEQEHSDKIKKYIEDRNETAYLTEAEVEAPVIGNYRDMFVMTQEREWLTTDYLQNISKAALTEGDMMTFGVMQDMIAEQIEEENIVQTVLDRITSRCGSSIMDGCAVHDIDVWLAK